MGKVDIYTNPGPTSGSFSLVVPTYIPFYKSLRLHKLSGILADYYSVSIDMKRRILIDFIIEDKIITLIDIGDHNIYHKK